MISIIVPTFNEESTINKILDHFASTKNIEVIVVDGGSADKTVTIAGSYPAQVIEIKKNRADQMNAGASVSQGESLLFLHADCILEDGALGGIERCLNSGYSGGCLSQRISSDKLIYRFIEYSGNIRAKIFKIFYGDQAIFVKRNIFFEIGGFDRVDLFDDVIFSKKMRKAGRVSVLNEKVYTTPRRWQKQGTVKTTLINWIVSTGFILGISPRILKKIYPDIR